MQTRGGGEGIFSTVITGLNMLIKQADSVKKGHKRGGVQGAYIKSALYGWLYYTRSFSFPARDYKLQNIVYSTGCILRTESERGSAESATERYSGLKGNLE